MTDIETRERIDEQAAHWAARTGLGEMTTADAVNLETWLAADPRHRGAYLRAQASYYALEAAALADPIPTASNDDEPSAAPHASRRWWGMGAAVAAAACVVAIVVGTPGIGGLRMPAASSTQTLALADGSSVTLGKDGAIASAMAGRVRNITLSSGSATFHVAKDKHRPFVVRSGKVYAEATGTIYSVRRVGAAGGAVEVTEGSVRVWAEGARDKAVMLHVGGTLTLDPTQLASPGPVPLSPGQESASFWFENISISEAAERFNRVNGTRIVIADPAIGSVTIMGGFRSDRPQEFARAAAAITGARVVERERTLVIEKK